MTISSANILLKVVVYLRFFNHGLTYTLIFLFAFCIVVILENMYSVDNKLNTWFSLEFEFMFLVFVVEVSFLRILHEFHEIKLNIMKYGLKWCFMK